MPIRQARLARETRGRDALDEFACENAAAAAPVPAVYEIRPAPRVGVPVAIAKDRPAAAGQAHTAPTVRVAYGGLAAILASVASAVGVTAWLVANANTAAPVFPLASGPSPVDVQYPDYTGAGILDAPVAARPALVESEPPVAPRPTPESRPLLRAAVAPAAGLVPQLAFDVRGTAPQAAVATAAAVAPGEISDRARPADAPPRRVGPPLTVTTLGGAFPKTGRLVLLLDVTETGEVARVVSEDAVDLHPDVVDTVSVAARSWRYDPARRDGAPVPARVRVVVQLQQGAD